MLRMAELTQLGNLVLQIIIPVASFLISILGLVLARTRRGLSYKLISAHSLAGIKSGTKLKGGESVPAELARRARTVARPHLLLISLQASGGTDIRAEDFSGGKPLKIDLGARLVTIVRVDAGDSPRPEVRKSGTALAIYPSLLRGGHRLLFYVLVDGRQPLLTCELSPLADVRLRRALADQPGPIVQWVPCAGVFSGLLLAAKYPNGNLPEWALVGAGASGACIWLLFTITAIKVIRMIREYRDIQRRFSLQTT
jgi:hypothetical protein